MNNFRDFPLGKMCFNKSDGKIQASTDPEAYCSFYQIISSADLLYRFKCMFPKAEIESSGPNGYKVIWSGGILHAATGYGLGFSEWKGAALLRYDVPKCFSRRPKDPPPPDEVRNLKLFTNDTLELLNTMITDNRGSFFYHPFGVFSTPSIAIEPDTSLQSTSFPVMSVFVQNRGQSYDRTKSQQHNWNVSDAPLDPLTLAPTSSFIRFDKKTCSFPANPSADLPPLTHTISSSLLFYRLISVFEINSCPPVSTAAGDVVGVWAITLECDSGKAVFFDWHGLANVRFDMGTSEDGMDLVRELLAFLCSNDCLHPYDGLVAGSVA